MWDDLAPALLESMPDAIIVVDQQGQMLMVNQRAEELFGYARAELVGSSVEMLVPEAFRGQHREHRNDYAQQPSPRLMTCRTGLVARRKDGSHVPVEISLSPLQLEQETLTISAVRDRSQQERTERALRASEQRFRADMSRRKRAEQKLRMQERELFATQRVQEQLLPAEPPRIPTFDIAGTLYPAEYAAGDLYDFQRYDENRLDVVVGDVSGHGISSSLVMAATHAYLHAFGETCAEVSEIFARTNSMLCREGGNDRFVTALLIRFDFQAGILEFVNAGHPPGYLFDATGNVKEKLRSNDIPLGVTAEADFTARPHIPFEEGDTVFMGTDGIFEAVSPRGDQFGIHAALQSVVENRQRPAAEIVERLYRRVCRFAARSKLTDDFTAVVARILTSDLTEESPTAIQ
jgi:PAS domain S-box-containing protein